MVIRDIIPDIGGVKMKDIAIFPTQYGVASLILREIPYRGEAYIRVQDVQLNDLPLLLKECADFCRACGAETIFWTGMDQDIAPDMTVLRMQGTAWVDEGLLQQLFPVTEATAGKWRNIYNEKMRGVPQATTLSFSDEPRLVESSGAYFIHQAGELLGIGWLDGSHLLAIASCKPGSGAQIFHTMMSLIPGEEMTLEVADQNQKAIDLYKRMGFIATGIVSKWYLLK